MTASVTLKITSDTSTLRADVRKTKQDVESLAPAAQQAGNAATQSFEKVSNAAKKTAESTNALTRGFSEFKQLLAGLGTVALVKQLTSMADEYANISAKLKLVTSGTDQFNAAQNRVFEIAQRTSSGLNETATLATKVTRIFLGMGESNESALNKGLKLTETLQKALAVSNATVSEANSLVLQLGQALQSGVLQGDEFRSVMENGGRVIQALTEYTGKSVAELRKMAEQGQLTAATVTNALSAATGKIDKEFSKIPLTIERAFTQLRNSILQYIGQADQASVASKALAGVIVELSKNLPLVANAIGLVGAAFAVKYVAGLVTAATASQALILKNTQLAASQLAEAQSAEAAALAHVAKARAVSLGIGPTVQLTAAESALTAAQARTTAAMAASTAATAAKTGMIARLGSGLLAFVGGPVGVAILALGGLAAAYLAVKNKEEELQRQFDSGIAKMKEAATNAEILHDRLTDLSNIKPPPIEEALKGFNEAAALATQKQEELNNKRRALANIEEEIKRVSTSTNDALSIQLLNLVPKAENLKQQIEQLGKELTNLQSPVNQLSGDLAQRFAPALDGIAASLDRIRNASSLGAAFNEIKSGITGFLSSVNKITEADKQYQSVIEQLGLKTKSVTEELKTAGKTQVQVAQDFAKAALESAKAANIPQGQLDALKKQLDLYVSNTNQVDKLKNAHKGESEAKKELRDVLSDLKTLEKQYNDELLKQEEILIKNQQELDKFADQRADFLLSLQREIDLIGLSDQQRDLANVTLEAEKILRSQNIDLLSEEAQMFIANAQALELQRQARIKEEDAINQSKQVQKEYLGIVQNGLTSVSRSIADFATGSIKKWSDFGKSLKDTAKQFIADIIQQFLKLKFVNPIMNSLFKVGLPTMASGGALAGNGSAGGLTGGISGLSNLIGGSGGLISAIAGLTAGIGAFKSSGGGAGGLIGGAATGIGTYFAGSALTAGAGALGAGAGIAGAATAAIGAIPVAGWVALGAMAVNKLTGGGLFGTKYKATGASNTTFDLSGGVSTQIEESKKKAFFGGTKTRYVAGQVDPEAQKAFNDFLTGLKEIGTQASQALGTTAVDIITGSFKQVVDKKGNLKDQFSTVLGKIYKESFEDFQKRAKAETIVAQVQQVAPGANSIVDSFRGNASKLLDVAQLMLAAQVDMTKGNALLSDSLADTVTFVNAHAEANETLTQTYARLQGATALLQQATDLMGINLGKSKEEFITFAADIAKAAGGLDQATQLWNGFFQNFYTETEALAVQLPKLIENAAKELADIGLDSSTTKDQLKQQFNDLLPTLSPEQVVQWLEAANALNAATVAQEQYNQSIGNTTETIVQSTGELLKAQTDYFKMVNGLQQELGGGSAFAAQVSDIRAWEAETVDAMNKAAIAAGMQGAAEQDLALVHTVAQQRISAAAQQLLNETKSLIDQLYGSGSGFSQSPVETFSTGASSGLSDVSSSLDDVFEKWQRGLKGVKEFLDKILLDKKLTTLTPEQQLNEAQKQFQDALKLAKGGDAEALAKLPDMANTLLTIGRDFFSSGDQYTALFNGVRDALKSLPENSPLAASPGSPSGSVGGNTFSTYLDQRDAKVAEQEAAHRAELAQQLAQHLRDLSEALNKPILELMESMGVNLNMLAADLGINLQNITGESVKQLADLAQTLGLRLGELTTGLGLTLTDLGGGITELTTQLGIDFNNLTGQQVTALAQLANDLGLSLTEITTATGHQLTDLSTGVTQLTDSLGINLNNLTVESTNQLAQLAQRLGADLSELSQSVGVDLGSLADSQSLLNQSLSSTIETLPKGQRDQLEPLLNAITSATSEADANAAIRALEEATKGLPAEQRDQLAPYFEGIFPASASTQLDYLSGIYEYARSQLDAINETNNLISQLGAGQDVPGFAVGTSYVPKDMMANIHKGEMVIDPEASEFLRNYGIQVKQVPVAVKPSSDESVGMLNALREVQKELKGIREGQSKDTNTTVAKTEKLIVGFENMVKAIDQQTREIARTKQGMK